MNQEKGIYNSYVICTSPRSGSTLLCGLLAQTSIAGAPDSFFHRSSLSDWMTTFGLPIMDESTEQEKLSVIVQSALAKGSQNTGMFGLRLQRNSADFLIEKLGVLHPECSTDAELFHATFGNTAFVHLTRCNKIEQAVSLVKAEQTGLWHRAYDGTELERQSAPQIPSYDSHRIMECVEKLTHYDQQWNKWFVSEGLEPIQITYEKLSAQPVATVTELLEQLGRDGRMAEGLVPAVAKLSDDLNDEWVTHFCSEFPDISSCIRYVE